MNSTGLCTSSQRSAHQAPARAADAFTRNFRERPPLTQGCSRFPSRTSGSAPATPFANNTTCLWLQELTIRNYHFTTLALTRRELATHRSPARRIDRSDRSQQGDWLNYSLEVIWIRGDRRHDPKTVERFEIGNCVRGIALPRASLYNNCRPRGCQSITFYVKSPFGRNRTAPAVLCRIAPKCLIVASTRLWTGSPH